MIKNISNLGDAALYCDFGKEVNKEINLEVVKYFKNLKQNKITGVTNIVPSYNKLIIVFDLKKTNFNIVKKEVEAIKIENLKLQTNKVVKIPICCNEEYALDISRLEKKLKKSENEIFESFFSKDYYCYMTGFIAGMPFLGDIDKSLRTNRLSTPRVKVPQGSIGFTEQFCNIYAFESPGGWNIIGNTPIKIFNQYNSTNPTLINPGDKVVFYKITKKEYLNFND